MKNALQAACVCVFTETLSENHYYRPWFTDKETEAQRGRSSGPGHTTRRWWSWESSKPCRGPTSQRQEPVSGSASHSPCPRPERASGTPLLTGLPWLPCAFQIKTKLSEDHRPCDLPTPRARLPLPRVSEPQPRLLDLLSGPVRSQVPLASAPTVPFARHAVPLSLHLPTLGPLPYLRGLLLCPPCKARSSVVVTWVIMCGGPQLVRTEPGLVADGVATELVPPHAWLLRQAHVGTEVPVISMLLSGGGGLK